MDEGGGGVRSTYSLCNPLQVDEGRKMAHYMSGGKKKEGKNDWIV